MSKPSLSFGLKKTDPVKAALPKRKPKPFGGDDGSDEESNARGSGAREEKITELSGFDNESPPRLESGSKTTSKPRGKSPLRQAPSRKPLSQTAMTQFGDLSSALESRKYAEAAEAQDALVYDYDGVYDSMKIAAKKKAEAAEDVEKRPKYFGAIQRAAEVRERDRLIAEEKRLKRERDAEGAEFADKEKFVTEAYRKQQEENRRLEEEERRREEDEAKKNKGKGMTGFYQKMLSREEELHAEKMKAAEKVLKAPIQDAPEDDEEQKTETDLAREMNQKGGNVVVNEDGEVVDKRQLLKGGLNVAAKKKTEAQQERARQASGAGTSDYVKTKGIFAPGGKQGIRERQTRMLEAQLAETLKRSRQEEEEEREKVEVVSKSRKTESDISSAKERYLARKRAAGEAKKKGLPEVP